MPSRQLPPEIHKSHRVGWLRAAVLGAQDGVGTTAALVILAAAAHQSRNSLVVAGVAALVAGAFSMASGEYNSVSSQRDTELADIARESEELHEYPDVELEELTQIYEKRGLDRPLARQVAIQLTKSDALGSHMRDELGITEVGAARPMQAAAVSAAGFTAGALPAVLLAMFLPRNALVLTVGVVAVGLLAAIGAGGASLGGAPLGRAASRVAAIGTVAMLLSAGIGSLLGTAI